MTISGRFVCKTKIWRRGQIQFSENALGPPRAGAGLVKKRDRAQCGEKHILGRFETKFCDVSLFSLFSLGQLPFFYCFLGSRFGINFIHGGGQFGDFCATVFQSVRLFLTLFLAHCGVNVCCVSVDISKFDHTLAI